MERVTVFSHVGADGILHVSVPLGATEANRPVQVTVESVPKSKSKRQSMPEGIDEYQHWLDSLSGRWQGSFARGDEGALETRESLS